VSLTLVMCRWSLPLLSPLLSARCVPWRGADRFAVGSYRSPVGKLLRATRPNLEEGISPLMEPVPQEEHIIISDRKNS
jgi:hypothetical protein